MSISIFWFRRDLRLFDNHGLWQALKSGQSILPLFIFDKNILDVLADKNDRRVSFIYDTLVDLQKQLIRAGSSLYITHDTSLDTFKKLANEYDISTVFTNHDYEPYAIQEIMRSLRF